MNKKILDLNFQLKNLNGVPIKIESNNFKYENLAKYLADILLNIKSENSQKLRNLCSELWEKGFIESDMVDINFLKSHIKKLELPTLLEATILDAFDNLKDSKK